MKAEKRIVKLLVLECNPYVKRITFTHAATGTKNRRKGWALYGLTASEQNTVNYLTIEPVNYSNGDKWLFYGPLTKIIFGYSACHYAKNICQVINQLNKK